MPTRLEALALLATLHAHKVTFGQLRRSAAATGATPPPLDPDADIRLILEADDKDLPEGFERVSSWIFVGQGYLDLDSAAAAVTAAAPARTRRAP